MKTNHFSIPWRPVICAAILASGSLLIGCGGDDSSNSSGDYENSGGGGNGSDVKPPTDLSKCQKLTYEDDDGGKTLPKNTCYTLNQLLSVHNGQLNIEEGVQIISKSGGGIVINHGGLLNVEGTSSNPVMFLGAEEKPGAWEGIEIRSKKSGTHTIKHAIIRHAGGGVLSKHGLSKFDAEAAISIENVRFESNLGTALVLHGAPKGTVISKNVFENNVAPLRIPVRFMPDLARDNSFINNEVGHIEIYTDQAQVQIEGDVTWRRQEIPYRLRDGVYIKGNVTIEPGTVFEFSLSDHIHVAEQGTLKAVGDSENRIVFRGDTGQPGNWSGLRFVTHAKGSELDYVDISDAGFSGTHAMITLLNETYLKLGDVHIANGKGHGIRTVLEAGPHSPKLYGCQDVTFTDLARSPWHGVIKGPEDCETP